MFARMFAHSLDGLVMLLFIVCVTSYEFSFPSSCRYVTINLGSNIDPLLSEDETVCSVAFEANLKTANQIPYHSRLFVIPAAVSGSYASSAPLIDFHIDPTRHGDSSSLSEFHDPNKRVKILHGVNWKTYVAPLLPFSEVMNAVPSHLPIILLKTDMQGHDYDTVSSIGCKGLERVERLKSEIFLNNVSTYSLPPGISNDYLTVWKPFMEKCGWVIDSPPPAGIRGRIVSDIYARRGSNITTIQEASRQYQLKKVNN